LELQVLVFEVLRAHEQYSEIVQNDNKMTTLQVLKSQWPQEDLLSRFTALFGFILEVLHFLERQAGKTCVRTKLTHAKQGKHA
jgi:hypothetical protein